MIEIFEIILFILTGIYIFKAALIIYGTTKLKYSQTERRPDVTIIVVARNEEINISDCLESLSRLKYPKDKLEIILIDDRSGDRTPEIIRLFANQHNHVRCIFIDAPPSDRLSGKASAVSGGIEISKGEIILLTDADCILPEYWVEKYVSLFTKNVGLVAGITLLDKADDDTTLFGKIQSLDWAYLLTIGAGAVGVGVPLSCVGNNFAFRKQVYNDVGGFKKLGFSLTEDFSFVRAIIEQKKWQIRYSMNPDLLVQSKPLNDFKSFYHQRKRWSTGSFSVRFFGKILIASAILIHIFVPVSFWVQADWKIPLCLLTTVLLSDFCLLFRTSWLLKRLDFLKYFFFFELFYFFYTTLFMIIMPFSTKVKWKNIVYDIKKGEVCKEYL